MAKGKQIQESRINRKNRIWWNQKITNKDRMRVVMTSPLLISTSWGYFDPTKNPVPNATIQMLDTTREMEKLKQRLENIKTPQHEMDGTQVQGVHSIKVLRDSNLNQSLKEDLPQPPSNTSQPQNQGENRYEPEKFLDEDSLLEKIKEFKEQAKDNAESQYLKIVEAIKNVRDEKQKTWIPN